LGCGQKAYLNKGAKRRISKLRRHLGEIREKHGRVKKNGDKTGNDR
jgi:hypothetical protein